MELDPYAVSRDADTGQFLFVLRRGDRRHLTPADGSDYERFEAWSAKRNPPLDASPYVFPPNHHSFSDLRSLVEHCKQQGITLAVDLEHGLLPLMVMVPFPDRGLLYQLCAVKASSNPADRDGITKELSGLWVTPGLFEQTLQPELQNENSQLRRVSSWTITRTFVYIDVSDFSKHPAGQEALIVNSLVGIVNPGFWEISHVPGTHQKPEAMMCIGDGYIFVFKEPLAATYFAAYLAYIIELLAARKKLAATFHFRMGVHIGPVYCFWDPGRNDWNYIGDGINGGNRVLEAVGKDTDDVIYISGDVREALIAGGGSPEKLVLNSLLNRGRKADKHGKLWRVYELNHTALCTKAWPPQISLPEVKPLDSLEPVLWLRRDFPVSTNHSGAGN